MLKSSGNLFLPWMFSWQFPVYFQNFFSKFFCGATSVTEKDFFAVSIFFSAKLCEMHLLNKCFQCDFDLR